MTVMEAARILGASIQEDPRFAAYQDAQAIVADDEQVKELSDNLQTLQDQFNAEAVKEQPDEKLLNDLQEQGSAMYQTIYQTPAMTRMMDAKEGMDAMMNEVMNFLYLVIGGADPKTVEVTPETMQQMQAEMMQMQQ
ncbi:MAG: YlbF family regulator [Eubacteriales bacterium]|nr:YlbF family regulator [Eubacteriales bacterium]